MFLKMKNEKCSSTWEQCIKIISKNLKYNAFKNLNEKKQGFNAYKRKRNSRENLEKFLMSHEKIDSITKYYR